MQTPSALERFRAEIDQELRAVVDQREAPLHQLVAYQLGWVDEGGMPLTLAGQSQAHGVLCLLAAQATGGDYTVALPAAAAVELLHHLHRVHGHIQSGTPDVQGRPALWWLWGPAQAINAGDAMHAMARLALLRSGHRGIGADRLLEAVAMLDEATLRLCEGLHLDLAYQERLEVLEEAYMQMAEGKTGALLGCALALGSFLASADAGLRDTFERAGRKLGMAAQVQQDVLDLWPRDERHRVPASDVLNKKKTLPLIYGLAQLQGPQKRQAGSLYLKRVLEPQDAEKVVQLLEEVGAREYAQQVAQRLLNEALDTLDGSGLPAEHLSELKEVATYLAENPA